MGEERWRKDEILAAKIKKFLSVSLHAVHVSVYSAGMGHNCLCCYALL